nr:hypothetical protein [Pontivivens insulae]
MKKLINAMAPLPRGAIQSASDQLNSTPRKCVGFHTPAEVFCEELRG